MGIGILALLTGKTGEIITIAVFGALGLYILSMITLLALRKKEPELERPFKVPFYPLFPWTALVIAMVSLIALTLYNSILALLFFGMMGGSYLIFRLFIYPNLQPLKHEK
jgi:ethanolamine permease